MDKSCHSSGDSTATSSNSSNITITITTTTTNNNNNNNNSSSSYLKQLNKLSHKISKPSSSTATTTNPIIKKPPVFDHPNHQNDPPQQNLQPPQQQHQPPVYNINKNDFRDVVQKLTGSPAHERFSAPPPINQPKPPSSRLQRIRPPPLGQISNLPPHVLSCAAHTIPPPANPDVTSTTTAIGNNNSTHNNFIPRPAAPLSPLPPLPAVDAPAESPVSAYMRYLQNSISAAHPNSKPQLSGFSPLAPLVSPRWNNSNVIPQQQGIIPPPPSSQQQMLSSQPQFPLPSSPLPFGCLTSPRSQYPLLSPGLLFSPTSGQLNFPLSPTLPVPSPRWRGI